MLVYINEYTQGLLYYPFAVNLGKHINKLIIKDYWKSCVV